MEWVARDETIGAPAIGCWNGSERVTSCGLVFVVWVRSWVKARYFEEVAVLRHMFTNVLCKLHYLWAYVDEEGIAGPGADEHDGVKRHAGHVRGHGGGGSD